jgi:hypothetical protein
VQQSAKGMIDSMRSIRGVYALWLLCHSYALQAGNLVDVGDDYLMLCPVIDSFGASCVLMKSSYRWRASAFMPLFVPLSPLPNCAELQVCCAA